MGTQSTKDKSESNLELGMLNNNGNKYDNLHPENLANSFPKKSRKTIIISILIIILILIVSAGLVYYFLLRSDPPGPGEKSDNNNNNNEEKGDEDKCDSEECKKAQSTFNSSFKIETKVENFTEYLVKSTREDYKTNYTIFTNAILDIFTLNSTSPEKGDKKWYNEKYFTAIIVNSLCSKRLINQEDKHCELEKILDLNIINENNLRRNDEIDEDLNEIKKAVLPICIMEHTDTNLIISLTCPNTLEEKFKNLIIQTFNNIKPVSIKGNEFDKNSVNTIINEENDKIKISYFDYICLYLNEDQTKNIKCNLTKEIITDKEGNLISNKIINSTKILKNKNTINEEELNDNFESFLEKINEKNLGNFDQEKFKKNLNNLLTITDKIDIMEKNIYIDNFTNLAFDIIQDEENENNYNLRNLKEENNDIGIYQKDIYNENIADINVNLYLMNDIGLEEGQSAKAKSDYIINKENNNELSNNRIITQLNETLNKFVSLSKAANSILQKLLDEINEPLLGFRDIINENINEINNNLANKDLNELFDSTLSINELESLPFSFVAATDNLYNTINEMGDNILYIIDNARKNFKGDITSFLTKSHNLIFELFNNLSETTNTLSSVENKIVEVAGYYQNYTDYSLNDIAENSDDILNNYYKNEKNIILPKVNLILENFYKSCIELLEKHQNKLDIISDRINEGNINIKLADNEDYKKCINNIYNSKTKINEIIELTKSKFEESINLQSNGYFENEKELEENIKSYGPLTEKLKTISKAYENNELVDTVFDDSMKYFRNKFFDLIKLKENSVNDKFPIGENVLSTSIFDNIYIFELDDLLKTEKINILNHINKENNNYLQSVNDILKNFNNSENHNLDQIMNDIINMFTYNYLDHLNEAFNESLYITMNNTNNIIEKNKNLAEEYLNAVLNINSAHVTNGFKNKYNVFMDSFDKIAEFINKNFKNNLKNKYSNVINQVRSLLQSIKSNKYLELYYKHLPLAEKHLNSINKLFETFNKYISDAEFNNNYLPIINNFIISKNESINEIKQNFEIIYNTMCTKDFSDINNDYDREESEEYCAKRVLGVCVHHKTRYFYTGYNVFCTNNHLNLDSINFEDYIIKFDETYNEFYPEFSKKIELYDSLLSEINSLIKVEESDYLINNTDYLNDITLHFESIIDEKLGDNLLNNSYNYYKNKIMSILPNELNNFIDEWSNGYEEIYNILESNITEFKSSISEFYYLGIVYKETYIQNISYDYGESIVEKYKNEFNYTNKYYYNYIISKLNQTFSYILSNIPTNLKPFDFIINKRIEEIKDCCNNILNKILESKNEILNKNYQEIFLQVNAKNFFLINDLISEHNNNMNSALNDIIVKLSKLAFKVKGSNLVELMAAKYYLENSINGKQIKDCYDITNKVTFIDLQNDVFKNLIDITYNIDKDDLIKNVLNYLNILNENNNNNFKYEKEKYIEKLNNKLYTEFSTKENMEQKIQTYFKEGLDLSIINKNTSEIIYNMLEDILINIKTHVSEEVERLNDELTSYSTDYSFIQKRLENYIDTIYEEFYENIIFIVKEFYEHILEKFYTNYILKGLNEFKKNINDTEFGTAKFLNMTINLDEIIKKESNIIIDDYNNIVLKQIKFLYDKNIESLDKIFSFGKMKEKINNEINNTYNNILLPVLEKIAIHNPGDEGIINYDLSNDIINDIDNLTYIKIEEIQNIIENIKGKKFIIDDIIPADFSKGKENVYDNVKNMFKNFSLSYSAQEKKEFNKIISENIINNFKNLVDNLIPSFGVDFYERILKYNEIQKIKFLYHNLKYSLEETLFYYSGLSTLSEEIKLPIDIKLKILTFNNLDSTVKNKNNFILSTLNDKLDGYFEETKNYLIEKYINDMNINPDFDLKFNSEIKEIIQGLINDNIDNYENIYINMMKENIKNYFIKEYTTILNYSTEDMNNFIENSKIETKADFDQIFSLDSDAVLSDTRNKINNTKLAIEEYNSHLNTFKISEEVLTFLDNFGYDYIVTKYNDINDLLNENTKELILNKLETLSNEFRGTYSIDNFNEEINKINKNLSSCFNNFEKILNKYGTIEEIYENNLKKELPNYNRLRLLDESSNNKNNNLKKIPDVKLDNKFNELKSNSLLIKDFIQTLNLFSEFDDKINKYIKEKNKEYSYTEYNLEKNKNKNDNYDLMYDRLKELNQLSQDYYTQANNLYNSMKEDIINNMNKVIELINSCEEVTFNIIIKNYDEIKNEFNKINESRNSLKEKINIDPYKITQADNDYTLETKIENYLIDNKFNLDLICDEETNSCKVVGKIINNILPKIFSINFYSSVGQDSKLGRTKDIIFNNISSYTDFEYDAGLNRLKILTNFDFQEYFIKTQYYEEKTLYYQKTIQGITVNILWKTVINEIDTPEDEKLIEIESKNLTIVDNYYY